MRIEHAPTCVVDAAIYRTHVLPNPLGSEIQRKKDEKIFNTKHFS